MFSSEFPDQLKTWITKSDHASEPLADFLKSRGVIDESKENILPYYASTEPPATVVAVPQRAGQAIVGAFRIFRELEAVPPFDKQLPFVSFPVKQTFQK